ncbi:ABC transporter substrate-binding protein [Companilactobacillus farciminis]|nr:ABC transporter substrate-binding protein [Companilactobacillus farciminis]
MKKLKGLFLLVVATFSLFLLAACGNSQASGNGEKTVKIGVTGSDHRTLDAVAKKS